MNIHRQIKEVFGVRGHNMKPKRQLREIIRTFFYKYTVPRVTREITAGYEGEDKYLNLTELFSNRTYPLKMFVRLKYV